MEPSLLGCYAGLLFVWYLIKTKPAFFWEYHKVKKARQELGDEMAERVGYGFIAFIAVLFTVLAWLDR